jgi:methylmalonyl-CoA mutase cobalamin-binding subunit
VISEQSAVRAAATLVDKLLLASSSKDPGGVRGQLDQAAQTLGLGPCIDDVLLPAMRQIGLRWQRGFLDIDTERLTSETVRGWLESVSRTAPEPTHSRPLVLACGPGDKHSIGLEAMGTLLRHAGFSCRMLGPRTSIRLLSTAIRASHPDAVILVSHLRSSRLGAAQSLRAVSGLGAELFYAGGAFATVRLRRDLPGTYLGTNIQHACSVVSSRQA